MLYIDVYTFFRYLGFHSPRLRESFAGILLLLLVTMICCPCLCREVSLKLRSDDVVFYNVNIILKCSVSNSVPEDRPNIGMTITDVQGTTIASGPPMAGEMVYTEVSAATNVSTVPQLYFCNVRWLEQDFEGFASLVIQPQSTASPACRSNYDDGIFEGETIRLVCYHADGGFAVLRWRTENDIDFEEDIGLAWGTVKRNEINVQLSVGQNGSVFYCDDSDGSDQAFSTCSVGPIKIYSLYIEPSAHNSSIVLSPGESQNFTCSSLSTVDTHWERVDESPPGVNVTILGSILIVRVSPESTFSGGISFHCSVTDNNMAFPRMLTVEILSATTTPSTTTETTSEAPELLIIIILAGIAGLLVLIVVVLLSMYIYCKCRKKTSVKPDRQKSIKEDREYAVPPFGYEGYDHGQSHDPAGTGGQESYSMVHKTNPETSSGATIFSPQHEQDSQGHGEVNNRYAVENDAQLSHQQETNLSDSVARVSMVYADPVKKNDVGSSDPLGNLDPGHGELPAYAQVNKSRHIPIEEGELEDDLEDYDDDAYWDP